MKSFFKKKSFWLAFSFLATMAVYSASEYSPSPGFQWNPVVAASSGNAGEGLDSTINLFK